MSARLSFIALFAIAAPVLADPPRTDIHGDPLPDGALARFGTVRFRIGEVKAVALSPDGKGLAADDGTNLTIWDTETGRPLFRVRDHKFGRPDSMRFTPDGKQLIHASEVAIHALDAKTGQGRLVLGWSGPSVGFVPSKSEIVVTNWQTGAGVYDLTNGEPTRSIDTEEHLDLLSPSGNFLLGHSDYGLHLVDARTGVLRCRFDLGDNKEDLLREAKEPDQQLIRLSPDDRRLYAVTVAGRLLTFDTATGKLLEDLDPPPNWNDESLYSRLALSPDGSVAYLAKHYRTTHRRDLKAGKWLDPLPPLPGGAILPHPDGKRLLVAGTDGVLHRYDLGTLREIVDPLGFDDEVQALPSPDGRRVAVSSCSSNGRLDLLDLDGRPLWSVPVASEPGRPRWSPDGRTVACAGKQAVTVCNTATGKVLHTLPSPDPDFEFTGLMSFDPDGKRLFASLNNGEAIVTFDLKIGGLVQVQRTGERWAEDISPDGRTVAFNNGSLAPALFDLSTGRFRVGWTFPPPPPKGCGGGGIRRDHAAMRFSPDGSYLLAWADDGLAILWDPATGVPLRSFETHTRASAFAFSADGLWLAIGTWAGTVSLWDVPTGESMVEWEAHAQGTTDVAFAGPGRLVTSSRDTTALLWDLRPRKKLKQPVWDALDNDENPAEAYRAVWALATDPKGPSVLCEKMLPTKPAPAGPVREWIAQLGADRFKVREEATNVLVELGCRIELELRAARKTATSEEVRTRLDAVLAKIPRERYWEEVVHARAVAAMELAGTPEAKKLLAEWAAGAPGARLTIDAKAALGRLVVGGR